MQEGPAVTEPAGFAAPSPALPGSGRLAFPCQQGAGEGQGPGKGYLAGGTAEAASRGQGLAGLLSPP